jgi:hypothetical protein
MVNFLLANRPPLLLWWGPDYISIYNDAYRPVPGTKHPWAFGLPFRECWADTSPASFASVISYSKPTMMREARRKSPRSRPTGVRDVRNRGWRASLM